MERRIERLEKQVPEFIRDLEEMFGPRDPKFEFGRIAPECPPTTFFRKKGITCVKRMGSCRFTGGVVDIHLTREALEHPCKTLSRWQLAHECLHLIDPYGGCNSSGEPLRTNVLEEGLATWYQNNRVVCRDCVVSRSYSDAENLVTPFMETLPGAIRRIRRDRRLAIGDIPEDVLIQYCPKVKGVAQKLTARFSS